MGYRKKHIKPKIRKLRKPKNPLKRPWFWILLLACILIGGAIYGVFFWQEFQVSGIKVSGNETIGSQSVENIAWSDINKNTFTTGFLNIPSKNIFLINTDNVAGDILRAFPIIGSVKVEKSFPHNIVVTITERTPDAVFCQNVTQTLSQPQSPDGCFLVDSNGVIYQNATTLPSGMVILSDGSTSNAVAVGQNVVSKNIVVAVASIQKDLSDNFQINVTQALVSNPLVITTSEGWKVYFDPTSDINLQITKLNALLSDQISATARKTLQYIYLQYQDRAYYK